jgi:hypothetical protein
MERDIIPHFFSMVSPEVPQVMVDKDGVHHHVLQRRVFLNQLLCFLSNKLQIKQYVIASKYLM